MIIDYVLKHHREECIQILQEQDEFSFYSVQIHFLKLFEFNPDAGDKILCQPVETLRLCDADIVQVQEQILQDLKQTSTLKIKKNVRARFYGLPVCPELHRIQFPTNSDLGCFLKITGTVTRITQAKMLEYQRIYICNKCKKQKLIEGDYEHRYVLKAPSKCNNTVEKCRSTYFTPVSTVSREYCKDYQEIKIQEHANKMSVGGIPGSMWITIEEDLVDKCKPGDDVILCGTVRRRWFPTVSNKMSNVELVFQANYLEVCNLQRSKTVAVSPDIKKCFYDFWEKYQQCPFRGRDVILGSVCPQVFGLYLVKLALLLTVTTGSSLADNDEESYKSSDGQSRSEVRGQCHLLLVGDPGTAKSQLLQAGAELTTRSVLTCGTSSTKAGLTCAAIKEDGEWQLEAGALVLSDGGACCVDEIGHLPAHDRAAIHEAMEQQTISVAKAGIVCKLNTRCAVIAACNPKGKYDTEQPLSVNVSLASPLLSRFDLIFILLDTKNKEWDKLVSSYILFGDLNGINGHARWTTEKLQMYISLVGPQKIDVSKSANIIMRAYYTQQRQSQNRDPSRTTVRMLDSLVRLSQAHCKIMYRKQVLPMDAIMAISLVDLSMQDCSFRDTNKALRSIKSKYPDLDYLIMAKELLDKLNLPEIWKEELLYYGKLMQVDIRTLENHVINRNIKLFKYDDSGDDIDIPLSASLVTSSYFKNRFPPRTSTQINEFHDISESNKDIKKSDVETKLAATLKKIAENNIEKPVPDVAKKTSIRRKRKTVVSDVNTEEIKKKNDEKKRIKKNNKVEKENCEEDIIDDEELLKNVPSVYDVFEGLDLKFNVEEESNNIKDLNSSIKKENNSLSENSNYDISPKESNKSKSAEKLNKFKCSSSKDYTKLLETSYTSVANSSLANIKTNLPTSQISIFDNDECSDIEFEL